MTLVASIDAAIPNVHDKPYACRKLAEYLIRQTDQSGTRRLVYIVRDAMRHALPLPSIANCDEALIIEAVRTFVKKRYGVDDLHPRATRKLRAPFDTSASQVRSSVERAPEAVAAELALQPPPSTDPRRKRAATLLIEELVEGLIKRHLVTLSRKYRQFHAVDDYGIATSDDDKWHAEVAYFHNRVIGHLLREHGVHEQWARLSVDLAEVIESRVVSFLDGGTVDEPVKGGRAFEERCASLLREHGWRVDLTKATGDQGIDLHASRDGYSVAIQCKNHAGAVGNSAVQEVIAGKAFIRANVAVVIAANGFTRAAKELALSTGVILMDPLEIPDLHNRVGPGRSS